MDTLQNFINGQWIDATEGGYVDNINPATGEVLAQVPQSTPADVNQAVQAALVAQRAWRLVPAPQRALILFRAGDLLRQRKEELAQILTTEMGKVIEEARGEVQEAIDMAFYMAGEGRRLFGQTTPSELPNKMAMSVRAPIGVIGMITPWNFPISIASWKIFPSLIAGNA
ncbi:MAG: aldehyde dehydrogenase family protein, partial [Firmicutes bacterium]|nr:aldehyde dehydrogenase family protein [Bacillota bacterium]